MSQQPTGAEGELRAGALSTLDLLIAGMAYMAPGFSLFFTTAVIAGQVAFVRRSRVAFRPSRTS